MGKFKFDTGNADDNNGAVEETEENVVYVTAANGEFTLGDIDRAETQDGSVAVGVDRVIQETPNLAGPVPTQAEERHSFGSPGVRTQSDDELAERADRVFGNFERAVAAGRTDVAGVILENAKRNALPFTITQAAAIDSASAEF